MWEDQNSNQRCVTNDDNVDEENFLEVPQPRHLFVSLTKSKNYASNPDEITRTRLSMLFSEELHQTSNLLKMCLCPRIDFDRSVVLLEEVLVWRKKNRCNFSSRFLISKLIQSLQMCLHSPQAIEVPKAMFDVLFF